jgi:hypothetical protein
MKNTPSCSGSEKDKMEMLMEFRLLHAKLLDEPEQELLTNNEASALCKLQNPSSIDVNNIIKSRRQPPECIQSILKPITRILNEGRMFFNEMQKPGKCHVCNGEFLYPHLAWGCVKKYSQIAVKEFMSREENQQFREKEYQRRLSNWKRKYGDLPCPYLKPPKTN